VEDPPPPPHPVVVAIDINSVNGISKSRMAAPSILRRQSADHSGSTQQKFGEAGFTGDALLNRVL
jgi:hypothetical protein